MGREGAHRGLSPHALRIASRHSSTIRSMKISLPPKLAGLVRARLASGAYADESDVVREALRALQREEQSHDRGLASIRRDLRAAADQLDESGGQPFDPAATKRRVRRLADSLAAKRNSSHRKKSA